MTKAHNVRPPIIDSVQLVNKTPMSLWFMVRHYNELVTGTNLNQLTSLRIPMNPNWDTGIPLLNNHSKIPLIWLNPISQKHIFSNCWNCFTKWYVAMIFVLTGSSPSLGLDQLCASCFFLRSPYLGRSQPARFSQVHHLYPVIPRWTCDQFRWISVFKVPKK